MSGEFDKLNFSQRNGLQPVPEQLNLGQVSSKFRRFIEYALAEEIRRVTISNYNGTFFSDSWMKLSRDLHVRFFERSISSYANDRHTIINVIFTLIKNSTFDGLFNLIEFLVNHDGCTSQLKLDLAQAFVDAQTAYRLKDGVVIAVGTNEQAQALLKAIDDAEGAGFPGARQHLVDAGKKLAERDWVGSVRESIHAVEATAVKLAPKGTLGNALDELEKRGKLHRGLKKAFETLYGYTSDQKTGVRHANVFGASDTIDEADALFMLGACASFVSYLIYRNT